MILIFSLSAENADSSSQTSGETIKFIINIFYPSFDTLDSTQQTAMVESLQFIVRKTAHFTLYAILGFLSFLSFITYKSLSLKKRIFIISSVCFLYSLSDEFHQLFIPGRSGELRDVLIDFSGSMFAILILTFISNKTKLKKYIYRGNLDAKKGIVENQ